MAMLINLTNVIEQDGKIILDELTKERGYPCLGDGLHNVQRAIIHFLYDYHKEESCGAISMTGKIEESFHLHSADSIHRSCLLMTNERLPLLTAVEKDNDSGYSTKSGKPQAKYITYFRNKWGEILHHSVINAKMLPSVSLAAEMPQYYPTMLPYLAFTYYANINKGITTMNLPLCPEEVFKMMRMLLHDVNTTYEELLTVFKGPDVGPNYTIVSQPQSLYMLLKEGYGKFDVYANLEFTRDKILFKELPYRTTLKKFSEDLEAMTFEHLVISKIENVTSKTCQLRCTYSLVGDSTLIEAQNELYDKTYLKKTILHELAGFSINNPSNTEPDKLDIMGLRDYLLQCLHFGYQERHRDIELQIEGIYKQVEINTLLEKLTRPETLQWFEPLVHDSNNKAKLLELGNKLITDKKYGKYIVIKGGITQAEVDETFKALANNILGRLNCRQDIVNTLNALDNQLDELYQQLTPDNIEAYLDKTLEEWANEPECKRQSVVAFDNSEVATTTKAEQIEQLVMRHVVHDRGDAEVPVNLIIYKDGHMDYWNPRNSENIPQDLMSDDIYALYKCTTKDTMLLMTSNKRHKLPVEQLVNDLELCNKLTTTCEIFNFQGALIYEWSEYYPQENEIVFMLTKYGKVKKVKAEHLLQYNSYIKPIPLMNGDSIVYAKLTTEEEIDRYILQVTTSVGIKRKKMSTVPVRNINGTNAILSTSNHREVEDFELIPLGDENTLNFYKDGNVTPIDIDLKGAYNRDIYKELVIPEGEDTYYSLIGKEYFTHTGEPTNICNVFGVKSPSELRNTIGKLPTDYVPVRVHMSSKRYNLENKEA